MKYYSASREPLLFLARQQGPCSKSPTIAPAAVVAIVKAQRVLGTTQDEQQEGVAVIVRHKAERCIV